MTLIEILLIAVALSLDAVAVSMANGISMKKFSISNGVLMAFAFGFSQAVMPILGWTGGIAMKQIITSFDHWIAFFLLLIVGGKMTWEAFGKKSEIDELEKEASKKMKPSRLFWLSLATSVDALAVGVSFAFTKINIISASLIIGVLTFALSFIGNYLGNKIGEFFGKKIEILGGVILIFIGTKILVEHLLG